MDKRLMHYEFPRDQIQLDGTMANLPDKIAAVVEDTTDAAIVAAILAAARTEGVTDLYLLDKKFILEAIQEKKERENQKPLTNADRIRAMTDDELGQFLLSLNDDGWPFACQNKPECHIGAPSMEMCNDCFLDWLRRPVKED